MSLLFRSLALALGVLIFPSLLHAQQPAATNAPLAPAPSAGTAKVMLPLPSGAAQQKLADAIKFMNATPPNVNDALSSLTQAIQLNPNDPSAYYLRGSIYLQRKQLPEAQSDFETFVRLDPKNIVIKYNLNEVIFMQKKYDQARAGFVTLQNVKDSPVNGLDLGDFAKYKVFLCDLFGGHEDVAKAELDAFNKQGEGCGYYFANAAWDLYHKNIEGARSWLEPASRIWKDEPKKFTTYGESLRYLGYLPLPLPKDGSINVEGSQ
jgi:tetratricopeptide (TPR) repeat protein